jgi:hypothetical protein
MASRAKTRAVWSKRVAAFERSGQSRREWCAAHGVSVGSLDAWRYRLQREAASGLVPVVVAEPTPIGATIELASGGVTLRLPMCADAAWLASLVRGLGSPC